MTNKNIRKPKTVIKNRRRFITFLTCSMLLLYILVSFVISPNFTEAGVDKPIETVTVRKGDTLWSIAEEYTETSGDIRAMMQRIKEKNELSSPMLIIGQTLVIPAY